MTIRSLVHTLPMSMIFARAKQFPAVVATPAAVSSRARHRPAQPARLEMRWRMSANGPVLRWIAPQTSEAGEPASEEGSLLLLAGGATAPNLLAAPPPHERSSWGPRPAGRCGRASLAGKGRASCSARLRVTAV